MDKELDFLKLVWISMLAFIYLMCNSCRTEYVPIETVRHDSLFFSKLVRDSVYIRDSICIREKGDTVFLDKIKYMYVYKELNDTVYIEKEKEVQVPVPVEKKLSWWERQKMDLGGWAMLIAIASMILMIRSWFARRTRKK